MCRGYALATTSRTSTPSTVTSDSYMTMDRPLSLERVQ
jgi:hypothetical protein